MAIKAQMVDENTIIINDSVKLTDSERGLALKFLTTPTSKWVGPEGRIPSEAGVIFPKASDPYPTLGYGGSTVNAKANKPFASGQSVTSDDIRPADPYDGVFDVNDSFRYDPHHYVNGNNYYYIKDSVKRATEKVYSDTWGLYLRARA